MGLSRTMKSLQDLLPESKMLFRKGVFSYNNEIIIEIQCGIYERGISIWIVEKGGKYKSIISIGSLINKDHADIATILTQRYKVPVMVSQEISEDLLSSERNIWLLKSVIGLIEGTTDVKYVEQDNFDSPKVFEGIQYI